MSEILASSSVTVLALLSIVLLLLGLWAVNAVSVSMPDRIDNNMNAVVVISARLIGVGGVVAAANIGGRDGGIIDVAVRGFFGLLIHVVLTVVLAYAYRGASDVVQKTGPLLPCAVLVASAQIPAALISIASII